MQPDIEARIDALIDQMTLEEKVAMCHGNTKFTSAGVERLGIPDFCMSDGPHGVREEIAKDSWMPAGWDNDFATYLPVAAATAATWNETMAHLHGQVLGAEARARGKDVILGPGVNITRMPTCGRNFEYYSEDPYLAARLGVAEIKGIQENDTAACVKHFALNSQERNRNGVDARPDDRTLREIFLPAFEAAVKEGGVLTVMGAYNRYMGQFCCQNERLLKNILKEEWGFEGLTVSDWNGVDDTDEAARNGMDIEMGTSKDAYDEYYLARPFREGLENGTYDVSLVNDKVRRILRVMFAVGVFNENRKPGALATEGHFTAARAIAEEAMVLLKNDGDLLPLKQESIKKLVVIGQNAKRRHGYGGGSSAVKTSYEISPLQGLQEKLGDAAEIDYFPGDVMEGFPFEPIGDKYLKAADGSGTGGWTLTHYSKPHGQGEALETAVVPHAKLEWTQDAIPYDMTTETGSLAWEAAVVLPEAGDYEFGVCGPDSFWLEIDGKRAISAFEFGKEPAVRTCNFTGEQGQQVHLRLRFQPRYILDGSIRLGWRTPSMGPADMSEQYAAMLQAAAEADAVLIFAGLDHFAESEGHDRKDLRLPELQNRLIPQVVAANPKTAVMMVTGSPVEMPWIDEVPAVLQVWFAGMEVGRAAADIIFGNVNPSGKLPVTFPAQTADSPAFALNDYDPFVCEFKEGVFVGYRWFEKENIAPLFAFGHGLSYTSFDYSDLAITPGENKGEFNVECVVTNAGDVSGAEVAQLYLSDVEASVPRPKQELKGFKKVFLQPGESQKVCFTLNPRDLSFYDVETKDWVAEPGEFEVRIGAGSQDIRLTDRFEL